MSRTLATYGRTFGIARCVKQTCSREGCENETKLALVIPLVDIEDDGTPGLGAVVTCSEHIEEMVMKLSMA